MSVEQELRALVDRYLASQVSFKELVAWENEHETALLDLGPQSFGGQMAASVSLVAWELSRGDLPDGAVQEAIAEHYVELAGRPSKA